MNAGRLVRKLVKNAPEFDNMQHENACEDSPQNLQEHHLAGMDSSSSVPLWPCRCLEAPDGELRTPQRRREARTVKPEHVARFGPPLRSPRVGGKPIARYGFQPAILLIFTILRILHPKAPWILGRVRKLVDPRIA